MIKKVAGRSGLAASQLVIMIIVIASFMLVAGMLSSFLAKSSDSEAEVLCYNSIALRAATSIDQEGKYSTTNLKSIPVLCKTMDKKITGDREELKAEIAYKMARCFWMFGEGRYEDPLQPSRTDFLPSLMGTSDPEKTCFNCYTILVDQKEIEGGPITQGELFQYMAENYHPNIKDTTYLEYFGKDGATTIVAALTSIDAKNGYMISILPAITREGEPNWLKRIAVGVAIVGGVVLVAGCTAATLGACAAVAGGGVVAGVAAGGASAAVAGGLAVTKIAVTTAAVAEIAGSSEAGDAPTVSYDELYKQRRHTSIYLSKLSATKQLCNTGDLAGG
jgi:hypothetical protein